MCLKCGDIEYEYGFDVTIQADPQPRHFHILMTGHKKDRPYVYGGICLDNGFQVNSDKCERHDALYDIIRKIVDGTIGVEKAYAERYPSQPFQPFKNILEENSELSKKFTKRMAKAISLENYKDLRKKLSPLWEKPNMDYELAKVKLIKSAISLQIPKLLAICTFISILPHCVPILYDCKDMVLASSTIQNDPRFSKIKINYRRV
jgi:hypothetical protein